MPFASRPQAHLIAALLLLTVGACSSDRSTGPGSSAGDGGPYGGTWAVRVGAVTGGGAACRVPSFTLALHQQGDSVAGQYTSHGHAACVYHGDLYVGAPGVGQTGGHLSADSVQFGFSLPLFTLHAHAHDSLLTGVLIWRVAFNAAQTEYTVLSGPWSAHRLDTSGGADAPADIQLYPDLPILVGGDSGRVLDTVRDAGGRPIPGSAVTFGTTDPATATVGPDGVVITRGGTLRLFSITAETPGAYVDAVAVNVPGAARVQVTPPSLAISRFRDVQLSVLVFDSAGGAITYEPPTFTVAPFGVVTITTSGVVSSTGTLGRATVTVHAGPVSTPVSVAVVAVATGIQLQPATDSTLAPGDTVQLSAVVTDSVGLPVPGTTITYASSNTAVLTVSSSGLVRSIGPNGSADITASSGPIHASRHFVVSGG